MNKRFSRAQLLLFTAWLALLVLTMVRGTLALPYLSDDFEHGQLIAQIRAGLEPGRDLITVPFHGQTLVLLRLLFWFGTLAGGMSLTWVRLGICAAHIAGAVGCAILCRRWTSSRLAGFLAATLYAGALGFIGEQVWWPSSGIFCLGATFFIFALVALDAGRVWLCVSMLALAALGLNGVLAAALGLPVCYWLLRGRLPPMALLLVTAALLAIGLWRVGFSLRGLELGAWLIFTAPLRFFSGFATFALPGFRTICELSPLGWLPLLASAWFMNLQHRRILLIVWTPAILLALLVGMARADYPFRFGPGSLYTADRYYYFFLFPLVTQCGLIASMGRQSAAGIAILTAAALFGSRAHYLANIPRASFDASRQAQEQGRKLVETIRSYPARPLLLTDARARDNSLTLAFLIYSEYPRGIPGVRLVQHPLTPSQAATENSLLNGWAARPTLRIDFKDASYEANLDYGFSWWEAPFRWMSGRASLHLVAAPGDLVISAYAPVDQLHRAIHVSVKANGEAVGEFAISTPGIHDYRLHAPDFKPGTTVDFTLTSDFVWHARDILPDSLDERDLSIAISSICFVVRP